MSLTERTPLPKRKPGQHARTVRLLFTGFPDYPLRVYSGGQFLGHVHAEDGGRYRASAGADPDVPAMSLPLVRGASLEGALDALQGYSYVSGQTATGHNSGRYRDV